MINVGRWLVVVIYGIGGVAQVAAGVGYLAGWVKPPTEGVEVPPGMEGLLAPIAGVVSLLVGLLLVLMAWGLFTWRNWARIIAIILNVLNLLALVIVSFQMTLTAGTIASGAVVALILIWLFTPGVQAAYSAGAKPA